MWHHFGFGSNLVQVGLHPAPDLKKVHGIAIVNRGTYRENLFLIVDRPSKLNRPSEELVVDIAKQLSKLGRRGIETIQLTGKRYTRTFHVNLERLSAKQVAQEVRTW